MRLFILYLLVRGIDLGALQSMSTSPIPSPTPARKTLIAATTDLPGSLRPLLHVLGDLPRLHDHFVVFPLALSRYANIDHRCPPQVVDVSTLPSIPGFNSDTTRVPMFFRI
jgi:hypothetical protein